MSGIGLVRGKTKEVRTVCVNQEKNERSELAQGWRPRGAGVEAEMEKAWRK